MASCDWKKFKGGTEAKAVFAHCESDERLTREHSNTDINKARTHLNMAFDAFEDGYTGVCKAYDDCIEALDANPKQNKRKDRVTCVGLEIPAPDGMSDDMAREWCVDAYEAVRERLGDTVLGGVAHFDEIHDYRDPETKEVRTSRPHLHIYAVPDVGGKLNAKQYTARRQMVGMNAAIEAMTAAKYPGFKFQNGTKKKSKKSVEALKNDSERAEIIAKAEAEAAKLVEDARQRADRMDAEAAQHLEAAEAAETASKRSLSLANEKAEGIIEAAQKEAQKASESFSEATKTLEAVKSTLEASKGLETARKTSAESKLERALEFMEGIKYKNGDTARKRFETKEIMSGHSSKTPTRSRIELERQAGDLADRIRRAGADVTNSFEK